MSSTLGYTTAPTAGFISRTSSTQCAGGDFVNFPGGTIAAFKLHGYFQAADGASHPAWLCLWTGGGTLILSVGITVNGGQQWYSANVGPTALSGYGQVDPGFAIGSVGFKANYDSNGGTSQYSNNGNTPPGGANWVNSGQGDFGAYLEYNTAPTITSFSPGNGGPGTVVTITGTEFSSATAVDFNGTSASFSITDDSHINATVPSGATTGPIHVTNPVSTATSGSNYVVASGHVLRTGVWTQGEGFVERSSVETAAQELAVFRTSVWTPGQ